MQKINKNIHRFDIYVVLQKFFVFSFIVFLVLFQTQSESFASGRYYKTSSEIKNFQRSIIDYRKYIGKRFKKKIRKKTKYIIIHTSELGKDSTLKVVLKGKKITNGYRTPGGHAHYVIARNGKTYRTLDKKYRADHAGLSMWQGQENISDISIGIELVGYHNYPLTNQQYKSVSILLKILKKIYYLSDKDILTHSQIAYGKPNPWFKKNHRGRKRCAQNFDRKKAGLTYHWTYDPDVRSGRLLADPSLTSYFYTPAITSKLNHLPSNIITKKNSAWSIAGEAYNLSSTIYILPDGKKLPGNSIGSTIGWNFLPLYTKVILNKQKPEMKTVIKIIRDGATAWSHAGILYNDKHTFYILPSGNIVSGTQISDWDDLPLGTRLIIGYKHPVSITKKQTAFSIAGHEYNSENIVYYIPENKVVTGNQIKGFHHLPKGTKIFLPL